MFKRLYRYIFSEFIILFAATFLICAFVLLMQFLWKYLDDLVGKGIDLSILLEFFLYAFITVIPLSFPLAVLLASLITFGNLAERYELLAMKAAGVSLIRIMRPIIIILVFVCCFAFAFSNRIVPRAQMNMWSLLYSIRFKSPELQIPEGVFFTGIDGYSIYVREKDNKNKLFYDVIIYDFTNGFNNVTVMLADTGKIEITEDKKNIVLTLMKGEAFENLKKQQVSSSDVSFPYRRETFDRKQILRDDMNIGFNRLDQSVMKNDYVSKNVTQLQQTMDSVSLIIDSINKQTLVSFSKELIPNFSREKKEVGSLAKNDTTTIALPVDGNINELYNSLAPEKKKQALIYSFHKIRNINHNLNQAKDNIRYRSYIVRRHNIEWHRKFAVSFACIIFFFIGAPLGAIIKKGGLGFPVVVSVLFFIVYYIINNTGYKMARDGLWNVPVGMWLSSFVLLLIGIALTTIAVKEVSVTNKSFYMQQWRKLRNFVKKILLGFIRIYKPKKKIVKNGRL